MDLAVGWLNQNGFPALPVAKDGTRSDSYRCQPQQATTYRQAARWRNCNGNCNGATNQTKTTQLNQNMPKPTMQPTNTNTVDQGEKKTKAKTEWRSSNSSPLQRRIVSPSERSAAPLKLICCQSHIDISKPKALLMKAMDLEDQND